jgi:predicted AAA+ superfamily ATPase
MSRFYSSKSLENNLDSFNEYLQTGGMPEYIKNNNGIILQHLVDDILYRDIAVRRNIHNVNALREMTVYLVSNVGKPVSARKFKEIYYFKKSGECDFVVMTKSKIEHCVQVCYRIDDLNMKIELEGLRSAMDYLV